VIRRGLLAPLITNQDLTPLRSGAACSQRLMHRVKQPAACEGVGAIWGLCEDDRAECGASSQHVSQPVGVRGPDAALDWGRGHRA